LEKVAGQDTQVAEVLGGAGPCLYYKNTGILYYATFTREAPKCFINGQSASSSRETTLRFADADTQKVMHCVLNSSLFYLLYQVHSNCRDLNPSDISTFRVSASMLEDSQLRNLSDKLHVSQQEHSEFRVRNQKQTGQVRIQSFFPALTKPLLDEIDGVLARHYGFTEEELDFIVSYDTKYRMGRDAVGQDDHGRLAL
jgi:hypothetical protein